MPEYRNWKDRRYQELGVAENPDDRFYFDKIKGKEDWYNKRLLTHIGRIAASRGIDPKLAISIAISESHGGNLTEDNPLHANLKVWGKWIDDYMQPVHERLRPELDAAYAREEIVSGLEKENVHM